MIEYVIPGAAMALLSGVAFGWLVLRPYGFVALCYIASAWFRALGEAEEHRRQRFAYHRPERSEEAAR